MLLFYLSLALPWGKTKFQMQSFKILYLSLFLEIEVKHNNGVVLHRKPLYDLEKTLRDILQFFTRTTAMHYHLNLVPD